MTNSSMSPATSPAAGPAETRVTGFLARWRLPLLGLVALVQAAVLGQMVWHREALIGSGREITLDVVPIDPRSLFRGDYVILSYDISRLPLSLFGETEKLRPGDRVFVRISNVDDRWQAVRAGTTMEAAGKAAGDVVLQGHISTSFATLSPGSFVIVAYGIESFFVPEGAGREIERDVSDRKVKAHLAVAADGEAAIKALTVDGERIDTPPLW